ncbi:adenylate/guanylate cyclase domain-containing protein [Ruegeria arenilitoris]|uniref:adenylate/guanylate cyclase domain-containing protein n=1 Tax=Ruegeria arenilitoris TaxID=1173585 RepID=UPI00147C4EB0|nr:adenylate/guanylate cyclase domain-containing protein [Ruegeria arenilitoris]
MERRLAAVLAADIVGFSRRMELDEVQTLNAVLKIQSEIVEKQITGRRGQVVKRMGDGWLAEFASAADAVNCALAIQSDMQGSDLSLRIGVNVGDITHIDGDIFGSGVNVAARLETVADSGGIAISADAQRLMHRGVDAEFHPNGVVDLKNIQMPVEVWSWPGPLSALTGTPVGMNGKPKLHLSNLEGGNAAAVEMASALRADLSHAFGRQTGLELVAVKSDADFKLGGSIRVLGDRWRVLIELVECATGTCVWTDRIDEGGSDAFDIQDRLCQRVAGSIRIRLPALLAEKFKHKSPEDMSVEELLNFAMGCNFTFTKESWELSRSLLQSVLRLDPDNWMAMTMLCWNIVSMSRILGWRDMGLQQVVKARGLIDTATKIRPNDHLIRTVRGTLSLFGNHDLQAARIDLEEALTLNPDYYHAINTMALIKLAEGSIDDATKLSQIALACDPAYPYRHLYYRDAGYVALVAGDHPRAVQQLMRADHAEPNLPANLALLAAALSVSGDTEAARQRLMHLKQIEADFDMTSLARLPLRDQSAADRISDALLVLDA